MKFRADKTAFSSLLEGEKDCYLMANGLGGYHSMTLTGGVASQTYEPWEGTWSRYLNGTEPDVDFTKWFHDLYRPNLRPYDPNEIALIKRFCALADAEFKEEQKK